MTPAAMIATRLRLGLDTTRFASLIGVNVRTVQRYESGRSKIPVATERLLVFVEAKNLKVRT